MKTGVTGQPARDHRQAGARRTTRRLAAAVAWRARKPLNKLLDRWERRRYQGSPATERTVVFLVGAPRTGSTVLYQLMTRAFGVGYLSNRHCRWFGAPSLLRAPIVPAEEAGSFASDLGRTVGDESPSECGEFWYRFFPRAPQYVKPGDVPADRLRQLAGVIGALDRAQRNPLLFKNMNCSLRLEVLGEALPSAIFVEVTRSPLPTAESILAARRRFHGTIDKWWSLEPPGIEELRRLPPEVQVVEQIRRIGDLIAAARQRYGAHRFLRVSYEALCADVRGTLGVLGTALEAAGVRRTSWVAPGALARTDAASSDSATTARLIAALDSRGMER